MVVAFVYLLVYLRAVYAYGSIYLNVPGGRLVFERRMRPYRYGSGVVAVAVAAALVMVSTM